jgi:polyisoprenoid-binding protein YceI
VRVERITRSSWAPVLLAAGGLAASLSRWYVQGSHNLYTALLKRFYVPDPDLGWRVSAQHPIWLGLDACAVIAALLLGMAGVAFVIHRRQHARGKLRASLRLASWVVALVCLAVPSAAFASGPGPLHGRDTLPASAAVLIETGIDGSLDAPEGRYVVVEHAGTSINAHVAAGGEAFDARFAGDITGAWQGNPRDLGRGMRVDVSVAAASVDTGIAERSKHARERYLHADQFPRITLTIDRVVAVRTNGRQEIAFRAPGVVLFMGKSHAVEVTGTVRKADAAALERLGLLGDVLLVQADFSLAVRETALAPAAHDFDGDRIPIHASLVLRRTGN